jgi:hypothetical protein
MESQNAATTNLRRLVHVIAGRWQDIDSSEECTGQAPWGYLVGVSASIDLATGKSGGSGDDTSWPVWAAWNPGRPQCGFTVLRHHPAIALRRFAAPGDWQAVGVAVHGVARRLGDASDGRAAVVWLCHRNGATASWLSLPGDDPIVTVSTPALPPTRSDPGDRGVVASLLRRSLRHYPDANPPAADDR